MGGIVGDTERNTRQALRIADAMAPSILFLDEVEKGLSGVASSGQTDGGVSARLFGTFLTWLNDHVSDVFVIATCNDITKLPPEFARAERFDGCFFLDLPHETERRAIWNLYLGHFELDAAQRLPNDIGWTGAEIRACCRLAALLDLPLVAAAENIVPVAQQLLNQSSARAHGPAAVVSTRPARGSIALPLVKRRKRRAAFAAIPPTTKRTEFMRTPQQLARRELLAIVDALQQALYVDLDAHETKIWNPDKPWNGAEVCDHLPTLLAEYDLTPHTVTAVDAPPTAWRRHH